MSSDPQLKHVAVVMDGNGRWAKNRGQVRISGHRAGAKAVRTAIEFAVNNHIEVLTLFALSVENLQHRPKTEVKFLLQLFAETLDKEIPKLHENNVRLRIIGDQSVFSKSLQNKIHQSEKLTADNTGLTLVIAINYSGRWDITEAAKKAALQVASGLLKADEIEESLLGRFLCNADLPEPDLLIRTSGEQRISNFMLWQFAYTELYFTPVFWPDFDDEQFTKALSCYQNRQRRFGKTSEQVEPHHA